MSQGDDCPSREISVPARGIIIPGRGMIDCPGGLVTRGIKIPGGLVHVSLEYYVHFSTFVTRNSTIVDTL